MFILAEGTLYSTGMEDGMEGGRFDPEKTSVRELLRLLLEENRQLNRQVTSLQGRSGDLLEYGRAARKTIVALGGDDPGSASDFKRSP